MAERLTDRQKRFVSEYLIDLNATQAAKRAGYSQKTAYSIGQENLKKPEIQSAIQAEMDKRAKRTEITQDRVLLEYAKIAFFDARRLFDENGKPKDIQSLDDNTAGALVGLDVQDVYDIDDDKKVFVGYLKKYKVADKIRALEALGRHIGLFEPTTGPANAAKEDDLSRSLRELGKELESDE